MSGEPFLPWSRLRWLLEAEGIDAVVASTPENVTYLSDYWGLSHWARRGTQVYAVAWNEAKRSVDVVVPAGLADLVSDAVAEHSRGHGYGNFVLEAEGLLEPGEARIALLSEGPSRREAPHVLVEILRGGLTSGRVAIEAAGMAPGAAERLADELPDFEVVPAEALLARCRAVKSARETALLAEAARISERAIAAALAEPTAGASELELARRFQTSLVAQGALPETTVIGTGRRSALPNALPADKRIEDGDVVRFDVGCRYGHYVADIARTVVVGSPTDEQAELYRALSQGLEAAAGLLRPGIKSSELFVAAVEAVRERGLPSYERTHCGHGIGIANYDLPAITASSEDLFEPGMVVCLETPYYRLGRFGLQVEDTFVVTADGGERFTHAPQELLSVG
jgi:Xaa-Pro dipeptidase